LAGGSVLGGLGGARAGSDSSSRIFCVGVGVTGGREKIGGMVGFSKTIG